MLRIKPATLAFIAMATVSFGVSSPLRADTKHQAAIDGRCQYSDQVARHRDDTLLILCDSATIGQDGTKATLAFGQRSWGAMAQFVGDWSGDKMAVSHITLRDGRAQAATGSCEIFHRGDGKLSKIACLAKVASRTIAANFVPSPFQAR